MNKSKNNLQNLRFFSEIINFSSNYDIITKVILSILQHYQDCFQFEMEMHLNYAILLEEQNN